MKLLTVLNKYFPSVEDYMDCNDDDDRIMYVMVTKDVEDCEPDYSVSLFVDGTYIIREINGNVLLETKNEKEVKNMFKVLA